MPQKDTTHGWFAANGLPRFIPTPFPLDWVIVTLASKRVHFKTRTMSGTLSKQCGSAVADTTAILELGTAGFWLGASVEVSAGNANGSTGMAQWIGGRCDGIKSHCYAYKGEGGTTGAQKNTTRVAADAADVRNLNGTQASFTPIALFIIPENANHVYMKTREMPTAQSTVLSTTVALGSEIGTLAANCGFTLGNSTLNTSGQWFHVLAFDFDAGIFDTLSYVGTGAAAATGVAPSFVPTEILSKGNVANVAAIFMSGYARDDAQNSKAVNGSVWHATGYIKNPTMAGWDVGAFAEVDAAVTHYAAYWKITRVSAPLLILPRGADRNDARLYGPASWWNTPIHPAAASDANAAGYIRGLKANIDYSGSGSGRGANINGTDVDGANSGVPYARGTVRDPLVSWTWNTATGVDGYSDKGTFLVRTPIGILPGAGSDMTVEILDETTGLTFCAFVATMVSDTAWTYTYALQFPANTPGTQDGSTRHQAVRNSGTTMMGGVIRKRDMMEGAILHRMIFTMGTGSNIVTDPDGYQVGPAQAGYKYGLAADGVSFAAASDSARYDPAYVRRYYDNPNAFPSGGVLRLKKSLTESDLVTLCNGNPRELIIARAAQIFGIVMGDGAQAMNIVAERSYFGNFRWDGYLDWRDARNITKSANMNTGVWDVVQLPSAWHAVP